MTSAHSEACLEDGDVWEIDDALLETDVDMQNRAEADTQSRGEEVYHIHGDSHMSESPSALSEYLRIDLKRIDLHSFATDTFSYLRVSLPHN